MKNCVVMNEELYLTLMVRYNVNIHFRKELEKLRLVCVVIEL